MFHSIWIRPATLEFRSADQAGLERKLGQGGQPFFVVARAQVFGGRHALDPVSERIRGPARPGAHRPGQRGHTGFPTRMKYRLVGLVQDRAETVHAAHVVYAVHDRTSTGRACATPIIASRLTSAASLSSSMFSVPSGRFGSTM